MNTYHNYDDRNAIKTAIICSYK